MDYHVIVLDMPSVTLMRTMNIYDSINEGECIVQLEDEVYQVFGKF